MNNTLIFSNGITTIDRPTLARSASYESVKGTLPMSRPVPHHLLLNNIVHLAQGIPGIEVKEEPIYATEGQSMRVMWPGAKEDCPVENYMIQRLATRIHLNASNDSEFNMSIGIGYNEKGITVAFGANVRVCSNQNVFGDNIMSTFGGDKKVPFGKMMDVLEKWLSEFNIKRSESYEVIERMQKRQITEDAKQLLFGKLIEAAVRKNARHEVIAPLNQTQVCDFIRASYSPEYMVQERLATVWDLQQMGTSLLKPETADLVSLYESNNEFNKFLLSEFQLN